MTTDLHTHSTASDGALDPAELVTLAIENGAKRLAITDHDTLDAYVGLDRSADIDIVPGIELSTQWNGMTIHVLGLNIDLDCPLLRDGVDAQTKARIERAKRIGKRLQRLGIDDPFPEAMRRANGAPGRPHFAEILVEAGIVKDFQTAFRKHLGAGKPGDVKSEWAAIGDIVSWIRAARGHAVLAHPAKYKMTRTKLGRLVDDFVDAGGQGLEVICGPQHPDVTASLARLCMEKQLLASAGSDFHTPSRPWTAPGRVAELPRSLEPVWSTW